MADAADTPEIAKLRETLSAAREAQNAAQRAEWDAEYALGVALAEIAGIRPGVIIEIPSTRRRYEVVGISPSFYGFQPKGALIRKNGSRSEDVSVIWREYVIVDAASAAA